MIGFIKGTIDYQGLDFCLVATQGIGYRVFMPTTQLSSLSQGQEVKLYTYLAVREDALQLYGFLTREYYELFLQLISVSGVGPKVALGILSGAKPEDFYLAIQNRDLKFLTKLPGIGKKTAERMLLELKDKVGELAGGAAGNASNASLQVSGGAIDEAVEALGALGYSTAEIMPALQKLEELDQLSAEGIIRKALKILGGGR